MANFRIIIDVPDVGGGDIDAIAQDLEVVISSFVEDEFTMKVQQVAGDNAFSRAPGDDVIQ